MPVAALVTEMRHDAETARREMLSKIMPLMERAGLRAVGEDILVAVYDRAGQKTAGGIFIPDSNREDQFQGKIGMVCSMGPLCGSAEFVRWFGDEKLKIGDFVGCNTRDAMSFLVGDVMFRCVEWRYLRFRVTAPDKVM